MQSVALRQTFHGLIFLPSACTANIRQNAPVRRHDHGAGPADAVLTADMGTRLAAVLADRISESAPRLDLDRMLRPLILSVIALSVMRASPHCGWRHECAAALPESRRYPLRMGQRIVDRIDDRGGRADAPPSPAPWPW
jgi:hypothetical protein